MMFWDASAVIPLVLREPRTAVVKRILSRDPSIAAWWGTPPECWSAFARLRREGVLTVAAEGKVRQLLDRLATAWTEVLPGNRVRDHAGRLLLRHPLRAADSLQLSAALVWSDGKPGDHDFVCLDHRLREAAAREGFRVLPEVSGQPRKKRMPEGR